MSGPGLATTLHVSSSYHAFENNSPYTHWTMYVELSRGPRNVSEASVLSSLPERVPEITHSLYSRRQQWHILTIHGLNAGRSVAERKLRALGYQPTYGHPAITPRAFRVYLSGVLEHFWQAKRPDHATFAALRDAEWPDGVLIHVQFCPPATRIFPSFVVVLTNAENFPALAKERKFVVEPIPPNAGKPAFPPPGPADKMWSTASAT